jgi:Tfp pilus assembly protein PilF
MKFPFFVLLFVAITVQANAQYNEKILQSANAWADAQKNDDFETLANYTSPKLLAYSGGREKWIVNRKNTLQRMPAIRDSLRSVASANLKSRVSSSAVVIPLNSSVEPTKRNLTFSKPGKIYVAGDEIYCLVPFSNSTPHRNKVYTSFGSVLAVSNDQGATWTFAEVTHAKDDFYNRFFPTFDKSAIRHKQKAASVGDNPQTMQTKPNEVAGPQRLTLAEWKDAANSDSRLLPKYGGIQKTKRQQAADQSLIETYLKELGTRRKASDTLISQGFSYLYRYDFKTAMYRFNQAWILDSTNVDVYWGYGGLYITLGDTHSALEQYNEGLRIDPINSKILTDKATIFMTQAQTKGDDNKMSQAIELFNASYAIDPKNQNTLYKLSVACFIKNDCANAKKYYNECKALGGKPIRPAYAAALFKKCP